MDRKVMIKITRSLSTPVVRPRMQIRLKSPVQDLVYDTEAPLNKMELVDSIREGFQKLLDAEDVAAVVRCRDCRFSRPPSALTQQYGVPGTLTCTHGACNRRNVGGDFFCADGEEREK